tara:strand:+ start:640 stop:873 length:234 start_codon:yes stop_codon:yes gene_type:complete
MKENRPGGWIVCAAYRVGVGSVLTATRVYEPAGFKGKKITIYCPLNYKWAVSVSRKGRTVFSTKREAVAAAEKLKED